MNLIPSTAQWRRWFEIVIPRLLIPTYPQSISFSGHGKWLTQEPPGRVYQLFHFISALWSQSEFQRGSYQDTLELSIWTDGGVTAGLFQFLRYSRLWWHILDQRLLLRQLILIGTRRGQLPISNFLHSDQALLKCVLHFRCIPHQNSDNSEQVRDSCRIRQDDMSLRGIPFEVGNGNFHLTLDLQFST